MNIPTKLVKWAKLTGSEGFEYSKAIKVLQGALENGFVVEV